MLAEEHPDKFAEALKYEQEHKDGRQYTWNEGETLLELLERKDEIIAQHERAMARKQKESAWKKQSLAQVLDSVLDEEDDELPCLACQL
jgi:hypothetical protein